MIFKNIILKTGFILLILFQTTSFYTNEQIDNWTDKYDSYLKLHVKQGEISGINLALVDYRTLSKDRDFLNLYDDLKKIEDIDKLDKNSRLAFWINIYNYLTIYEIIKVDPDIKSIKKIPNVWQNKIIKIDNKKLSLDDIEHGIIRKNFDEPRIHFAVVCASLSCPDLKPEAYRGPILEKQLQQQLETFLNNPEKGMKINAKKERLYLTKLFLWYSQDFSPSVKGWLFLKNMITETEKDYKIYYLDYDWKLNNQ